MTSVLAPPFTGHASAHTPHAMPHEPPQSTSSSSPFRTPSSQLPGANVGTFVGYAVASVVGAGDGDAVGAGVGFAVGTAWYHTSTSSMPEKASWNVELDPPWKSSQPVVESQSNARE